MAAQSSIFGFAIKRPTACCVCAFLFMASLFSSCMTTRNTRFIDADKQFGQGEYEPAADILLTDETIYKDQDQVLLNLDLGTLYFYSGNVDKLIRYLNEAERLMEEYFTKSVLQAAATFLVNDTVQDYAGEDYENIYINIFKALNFASAGNFDGAFVEIRRVGNKLNLLEDKYAKLAESVNKSESASAEIEPGDSRFYKSALAHFLSMVLYRADGRYDDARIDLENIDQAFQQQGTIYDFPKPDLSSSLKIGDGAFLSVVAFTGRAPVKQARNFRLTTGTNVVHVYTMSEDNAELQGDFEESFYVPVESGLHFKAEVPVLKFIPGSVDSIAVFADGQELGELSLIESVDNIAYDVFELKKPIIYLRTFIRSVIKGIVANELAKAAEKEFGELGGLAVGLGANVAADASEVADLRSGRYLPKHSWIGDLKVAPGVYDIELRYYDKERNLVQSDLFSQMNLAGDGLNLITSQVLR